MSLIFPETEFLHRWLVQSGLLDDILFQRLSVKDMQFDLVSAMAHDVIS
jgi:hypothetical protein